MGLWAGLDVGGRKGRDPRKSLEHCLGNCRERVIFSNGADLPLPKKRVQNIKKVNFGKRLPEKMGNSKGRHPIPMEYLFL